MSTPLCPQVTNTPVDVTYNSTDYDADSIDDVQLTTTFAQDTQPEAQALGDIWFDTNDGNKMYSWDGTTWTSRQDGAIATAGGNTNYYQTTAPTGGTYKVGDLWFDTDDNNKMYRWNGTNWSTAVQLGGNALANISASTITAGTLDASVVNVSNINAGNIVSGQITGIAFDNGSGTFKVTAAGALTATSANITGTITATSGSFTGDLYSSNGTIGGFTIGTNYLSGAGMYLAAATGNCSFGNVTANGFVYATTGLTLATGTATLSAGGNAFNNVGAYSGSTISTSGTITAGGQLNANSELYASQAVSASTTAATNCYITTSGLIRKTSTTSSQRYKENIVDIRSVYELDPKKLLAIPVVGFTYKEGHIPDSDDRAGQMLPGFIAEDVDAAYPIAADYEAGNVETWNERFIIPGLLALVQELYARIEVLEAK